MNINLSFSQRSRCTVAFGGILLIGLSACNRSPTPPEGGVIYDGRPVSGVARLDFTVLDADGRPVNAAASVMPSIAGHQYSPGAYVNLVQDGVTVDLNGRSSILLERVNDPFTTLAPDTLTIPYEVRFDTTKYRIALPGTTVEAVQRITVTFSAPAPAPSPTAQAVVIRTSARAR